MTSSAAVQLETEGDRVAIIAQGYRLELFPYNAPPTVSPYARLSSPSGERWADINLLSSAHTAAGADEVFAVDAIDVEPRPGDGTVLVRASLSSSAWSRHETQLLCTPDAVELTVLLDGVGRLSGLTAFGGRASLRNGACGTFRSAGEFAGVLAPAATEPVQLVRPAGASASLSVVGDAAPGRLNAVFSPPPLALGFSREPGTSPTEPPAGEWLGLSLRAPVTALGFTALRYEPLDGGFLIGLDYEGHTHVDGEWVSPTFVLRPAASGWAVLEDHRRDLVAHGYATDAAPERVGWWEEPLFCGWGAQCARAVHAVHTGDAAAPTDPTGPELEDEEAQVGGLATRFSRQSVYDEFLARLDEHDIRPGTVVIDDRWQAAYGTAEPDPRRWPELRRWIGERHAAGQKVLLWWKAWDRQGVPAEECIRDRSGRGVTVDPNNPAYRARLTAIVQRLLGPDGLDADGFKIDFTQRGPSGETLIGQPGAWGIAGLHVLLKTLYTAAKAAKPDSLVVAHAMHPSFGDVCDMVRLNDVSKFDASGAPVPVAEQLTMRHAIASRALPHHLVDTDQWPMSNRAEWLSYVAAQGEYGVPALYYLESIDHSGEPIDAGDLAQVAASWQTYRDRVLVR